MSEGFLLPQRHTSWRWNTLRTRILQSGYESWLCCEMQKMRQTEILWFIRPLCASRLVWRWLLLHHRISFPEAGERHCKLWAVSSRAFLQKWSKYVRIASREDFHLKRILLFQRLPVAQENFLPARVVANVVCVLLVTCAWTPPPQSQLRVLRVTSVRLPHRWSLVKPARTILWRRQIRKNSAYPVHPGATVLGPATQPWQVRVTTGSCVSKELTARIP